MTLRLTEEDGCLAFSVRDEGPGFDVRTVVRGTGLHSMADRMAALDGVLTIETAPGGPTVVAGRVLLSYRRTLAQAPPVPRAQALTSRSESNSAFGK